MKYHGLSAERRKYFARILAFGKGGQARKIEKTLHWR